MTPPGGVWRESMYVSSTMRKVHVKNEDTNEVTIVGIAPLDCPIDGQAVVQAALDQKFGQGAWGWWDAYLECGDWVSSSEI